VRARSSWRRGCCSISTNCPCSALSPSVTSAEDSAIVVRAKFTARPTSNAWVVRRVAYDKIVRAFRAAGIRFAHREVTVNASEAQGAGATLSSAGASALALESPARGQVEKAAQSPV
jgi:hydroxymethylpyrimidine/phosphomethylpyrimidine kinase